MRLLITAGPTREWIDPVRFISNASTGKMGYAVAREALRRGHKVVLVSGPVGLRPPRTAQFVSVETASEMLEEVLRHLPHSDALIMTAAVADYKPDSTSSSKIKRRNLPLILRLLPNPDILQEAAKRKRNKQVFVGFALEDSLNSLESARKKMETKSLDLIVLNTVESIGSIRSRFVLINRRGETDYLNCTKRTLAIRIVRIVEEMFTGESC